MAKYRANEGKRFKFECQNPDCGFVMFGKMIVDDAPGPLCPKCDSIMESHEEVGKEEWKDGEPINTCALCGEYAHEVGRTTGIHCRECKKELKAQREKQRSCPNCQKAGTGSDDEIKCYNRNCRVTTFKIRDREVKKRAREALGTKA